MNTMLEPSPEGAPFAGSLAGSLAGALAGSLAATDGAAPCDAGAGDAPPPPHAPTTMADAIASAASRAYLSLLNARSSCVWGSCLHLTGAGRCDRRPSTAPRPGQPGAESVSDVGEHDRDDQERADGDALDLGRDVGEPQDVAQQGEGDRSKHDPHHRPAAAEDVDAAQEDDR